MKNKLLFLISLLILLPTISIAVELRTLEIEFAFTAPDSPEQQLLGYRLYKEGTQVCESDAPNTTQITCDIPTEDGTFNFFLTAYYSDGTESPPSPQFPFTISSTPPVTTPPSPGNKTISYSWESNASIENIAGYKMYMNDTLLCEIDVTDVTSLSCTADLIYATMDFSIATLDTSGNESDKSNFLRFNPADFPETFPPPEPLQAVIHPTPASGEIPLNVSFTGASSTGDIVSYSWDFGDGITGTGSVASHTYSLAGTYTATLHITEPGGATQQTTTTITALPSTAVPQPPTAVLSSSTAAGDAPLAVTFNGTSSTASNPPIISYNWDFGDGAQATGETTSHSFTVAGTYHTTLTVEDSKGLTNSIDTPIIVVGTVTPNEKPTAVISATPPGGPVPVTISFDGSQSSDSDGSITEYSWNFGDGTTGIGQAAQHSYNNEGVYTVTLQVTDNKGETAIATSTFNCDTTPVEPGFKIEVGEVSINNNWGKVLFQNSFSQPIIIAGPPASNETEPVLVRIRNIDQTGFEVRLQEWNYQDGSHAPETFSYIVMEKGMYTLNNDTKIEAGSFAGSTSFSKVTLQQSYDLPPIILTQVMTENETDAVTGRTRTISQSSFYYELQEQESTQTSHTTETIGYIAWEPGKGEVANLIYEAGITTNSITHSWMDITFQAEFTDLPFFVASMQTTDGGDTATVRGQNISQTTTQIKIEEEQSKDSEISHTTEAVGYFVIGSKSAAIEPPQTPSPSDKKFTFTWAYGDTQNVSGFEFYLNDKQLCESTNPNDRQITCYAALLNGTMEFTMTTAFLDGSKSEPSTILSINPTEYPDLFGIRLSTFFWEYDQIQEDSISGFKVYNNEQLICETDDPSARQVTCTTSTSDIANSFTIKAIDLSHFETEPSNNLQYNP